MLISKKVIDRRVQSRMGKRTEIIKKKVIKEARAAGDASAVYVNIAGGHAKQKAEERNVADLAAGVDPKVVSD